MQAQTQCLEALTFSPKESLCSSPRASLPRHHIMTSNTTFPLNDDYIGTESCVDLLNDLQFGNSYTPKPHSGKNKVKREFPPPIPLLGRTLQNLPSHLPWVLKRYYTSDGRLILKEEKVRHHEYFRAHRANGRLTLYLVPLIHSQNHEAEGSRPHESNEHSNDIDPCIDKDIVAGGLAMENDKAIVGANGGAKCLNCSRLRSAPSCIFGVPVPPIRTVHS